mgnify:FL=1
MIIYTVYFIIFLIFIFIIYTTVKAINRGIEGKSKNKHFRNNNDNFENDGITSTSNLVENLSKLNDLYKSGAISEDEYLEAKKKIRTN